MAGLNPALDITMDDTTMFASAGGIPSSVAANPLSMDPGPAVAERHHQPYNNPMGLPSSNMPSQQLPYPAAPIPWGNYPHGSAGDATAAMDFTKQSNWIQQVVERLTDLLYVLAPDGKLLYLSPSCRALTGYEPDQIVGNNIFDFLFADDKRLFKKELQDSLTTGKSIQFHYRFMKVDGTFLIFEVNGHLYLQEERMSSEVAEGTDARVFLMSSRPYPSKTGHLLDSFLEHKMEHERLTRKIADLKREEEEEESEAYQWQNTPLNTTRDSSAPRDDSFEPSPDTDLQSVSLSAAKSGAFTSTATKRNPYGASSKFLTDFVTEKGSRFDNNSHLDGIELMTGLRYRQGERSHGISTADPSAALIQSDASNLQSDRENRSGSIGDKKKKQKPPEEYVCSDCGTLASPEWRKGPHGPKTLCNACGCESLILLIYYYGLEVFVHEHCTTRLNFQADLKFYETVRWAKKEKRRTETLSTHHTHVPVMDVTQLPVSQDQITEWPLDMREQ